MCTGADDKGIAVAESGQAETPIMFKINPDGVEEWVIAHSREEAFEFYRSMVGQGIIDEAYQ